MEAGPRTEDTRILEQHEQQKEKFKSWQHGQEETLELKKQEFIATER